MRVILIIMDGAADSGKNTPLKSAYIPNLNFMASNGKTGLIYTVKKGLAPESDVGVLSLLGYNPFKYYTGRGPLEMYGTNLNFKNFLALRANFATAINKSIIDRRVGRTLSTKEANSLANSINKKVKLKVKFIFKSTVEHRAILVFKSNLSDKVSNTDISYKKTGKISLAISNDDNEFKFCKPFSKEARKTASLINEFTLKSREVLKNHPINKKRIKKGLLPANLILLRDAGNKIPKLQKMLNWISVCSMPLEIGISKTAGMKIVKAQIDEKNDYYKNLGNVASKAITVIKSNKNSNIYVHFKETDIPGHDGNFNEKKKMLEYLDKRFFSVLKNVKNSLIIVTSDHATPVSLKRHSSDPVPILIYGNGKDKVKKFDEISCRKGSIHISNGYKLMKFIQNI